MKYYIDYQFSDPAAVYYPGITPEKTGTFTDEGETPDEWLAKMKKTSSWEIEIIASHEVASKYGFKELIGE